MRVKIASGLLKRFEAAVPKALCKGGGGEEEGGGGSIAEYDCGLIFKLIWSCRVFWKENLRSPNSVPDTGVSG